MLFKYKKVGLSGGLLHNRRTYLTLEMLKIQLKSGPVKVEPGVLENSLKTLHLFMVVF